MTFAELQAEADRQGYKLVKCTRKEVASYTKCGDCKYLSDEKHSIGYRCVNPQKVFKQATASFKSRSGKACRKFESKED